MLQVCPRVPRYFLGQQLKLPAPAPRWRLTSAPRTGRSPGEAAELDSFAASLAAAGWSDAYDRVSGNVYYYHTDVRTTWANQLDAEALGQPANLSRGRGGSRSRSRSRKEPEINVARRPGWAG